jgi:hypothetical protein
MISLLGLIVPLLFVILLGKHTRHIRTSSYILVAALAVLQTCIVLMEMFTFKSPIE